MSREGLAGVTIGRLAEQVGMSKSGVFAHFRSKEEVQIGLLSYTEQIIRPNVVEPAMKEAEGLPRLEALVRGWFGWAERAGLPGGCPVAAGMFELDDMEGPVREKIRAIDSQWRDMLSQLVQEAITQGHLRQDLDVSQFVWELCGIYLSHHVAHRFLRESDANTRAETAFQGLLERSKPVPAKARRRK